jgi:tetratricopeptide (TPR) repeat protein
VEGSRRVLLLGESAAAGYPLTEYGLGRMMRVLWGMRFPGEELEVVDMTTVGINSHVLRVFMREGLKTKPDAVVIYAGNNEVIGPYGAANVFGRQAPGVWWAQAGLAVGNTRTARAVGWLVERVSGGEDGGAGWRGLDEFKGVRLEWESAAVERVAQQAKENFRAMVGMALEAGCKVLVCVPAVNLTDWPPVASAEGGEEVSAMAAYERAKAAEPPRTEDGGRMAKPPEDRRWEIGDGGGAGAPGEGGRGAPMTDGGGLIAEEEMAAGPRSGEGSDAGARPTAPEAGAVPETMGMAAEPRRWEEADGDGGAPTGAAGGISDEAWELFRRACDLDQMRIRADSRVRGVQREVVAEVASKDVMLVDADIWLHEENRGPLTDRDFFLEHVHLTFEGRVAVAALMVDGLAELLGAGTDEWTDARKWWDFFPERVEEARERVMFTELEEAAMWEEVVRLLEMEVFSEVSDAGERAARRAEELKAVGERWKDAEQVREAYGRALADWRGDAELHDTAFKHLGAAGDRAGAREALERAVGARPNLVFANLSLAELAMEEGRREDAWRIVEAAEGLRPDGAMNLNNLAWMLATREGATAEERAEAVAMAGRAVELEPEAHRFRGTLAVSLLQSGREAEGRAEAAKAMEMARKAGDMEAVGELEERFGPEDGGR